DFNSPPGVSSSISSAAAFASSASRIARWMKRALLGATTPSTRIRNTVAASAPAAIPPASRGTAQTAASAAPTTAHPQRLLRLSRRLHPLRLSRLVMGDAIDAIDATDGIAMLLNFIMLDPLF